ncbi:hypothetical protein JTB14_021494 [Gonioctena quinquepunctata]|nr:hypothetical protein JTB14_021494 [Gonioctena quinquepunctata]
MRNIDSSDTPPWPIPLPTCNLYLTNFNEFETAPSVIYNHFYSLLSTFRGYTHIYTDASDSNEGVTSAFLCLNTSSGFKLSPVRSIYSGKYLTNFNEFETAPSVIYNHFYSLLSTFRGYTHIYTDASDSNEGVTSAFLCLNTSSGFKLSPVRSIYSGELFAILQAIKFANDEGFEKILIKLLQSTKQMYSDNPLDGTKETHIHSISETSRELKFMRVPSHVGIPENVQEDRIVHESMNEPIIHEQEGVCDNDHNTHMKSVVHNLWLSEWRISGTKLREIKDDIKPWRIIPRQRKYQIIITRLRTGHTRYTHEHLLKKEEEKMCQVPISVEHFLVECPVFANEWQKYNISADFKIALGVNCNFADTIRFLSEIALLGKL